MSTVGGSDSWSRVKVRELAVDRGLVGGPFGSSLGRKDYVSVGVPVIRGTNLSGTLPYSPHDYVFVSEAKADELRRNLAMPGDLVLTQRGTLGQVGIVPEKPYSRYVISQSQMRLRCRTSTSLPRFLYYVFRSALMVQQILSRAITTGVPHINLGMLGDLELLLPPLAEQRGIASVLGILDDKIESNRRLIAICSELLDTTSSSFALDVESVPLSSLAEPFRDTFDPTSLGTELMDHFSIPAFDANGLPDRTTGASVISAKLRVDRPAVLVSRLNPKTNRTWFAVPEPGVPAGCSTEFLVLAPKAGVTLGSLWLAVRDAGFRSLLAQRVTGTSGSHQRVKPLDALATEVPDVRQLLAADVQAADGLLSLMHQRRIETTRLAALRDVLLPELLSGRIRVPEAGEAVESALA